MNRHVYALVTGGGTGGHVYPGLALAEALVARGHARESIHWVGNAGKLEETAVPAAGFTVDLLPGRGLQRRLTADNLSVLVKTAKAFRMARGIVRRTRPDVVVGVGGYAPLPCLVAARLRRIPTVIHEQNAVMGRANRLLAPRVRAIATGFAGVLDRDPALATKATHTGNPVRPAVIEASSTPYPALDTTSPLQLLVFGGSQGAKVMSDIVPYAVERLEPRLQMRLKVVQQAREEDMARVREAYAKMQVAAEVEPFFKDLPARMAASHLVVARSGASTVAELTAIGRPGILVPLPHALDQDQHHNAGVLMDAGGAIRLPQAEFTPDRLAAEIAALAAEPNRLVTMAASAKRAGAIDASVRLADLVLRVAGNTK